MQWVGWGAGMITSTTMGVTRTLSRSGTATLCVRTSHPVFTLAPKDVV